MLNIHNADIKKFEKTKDKENSLCKSADTLSTRDLILNLNNSFITRKSKEYNFDFNKASSNDTNIQNSAFLGMEQQSLFESGFNMKKDQEIRLMGRKTSYNESSNTETNLDNFNNNCDKKFNNTGSNNFNIKLDEKKNINFNYNNKNNFICCDLLSEKDKENSLLELTSSQNISKLTRNTSSDLFNKLKERMRLMQQQKKDFEFFEAKNQKDENYFEDKNPNVYFE